MAWIILSAGCRFWRWLCFVVESEWVGSEFVCEAGDAVSAVEDANACRIY